MNRTARYTGKIIVFASFMMFVTCVMEVSVAQAEVRIQNPLPTLTVTSDFGYRNIGNGSTYHAGTDYRSRTPEPIGVTPGYTSANYTTGSPSAGNFLTVTYNCPAPSGTTVRVRYLHLSSGQSSPAAGMTGSSGTSAPHLHFEIRVNGVPVDPQAALDTNLCDEEVEQCLVRHRQSMMSSSSKPEAKNQQDKCRGNPSTARFPEPSLVQNPDDVPPETGEDSHTHVSIPAPSGPSRPPPRAESPSPPNVIDGVETRGEEPEPGGPVYYDQPPSGLNTAACDVDVFTLLRARASFEAQEDVIYSEMAIHKPDSVLEYSCFDQFMEYTATPGGNIFSETQDFSGKSVPYRSMFPVAPSAYSRPADMTINTALDEKSLDLVLENTVMTTMGNYLDGQFPHALGGDTLDLNNNVQGQITGSADYNCDMMGQVWERARCQNFSDTRYFSTEAGSAEGPFYQWQDMVMNASGNVDPRDQLAACTDTGIYPADKQKLQNAGFAFNGLEPAYFNTAVESEEDFGSILDGQFGGLFGGIFAGGPPGADPSTGKTLFDLVDPATCDGLPPIPTGVDVVLTEGTGASKVVTEYEEHFCSNPGCSYDYTTQECTH